jgi:hypothetical protein
VLGEEGGRERRAIFVGCRERRGERKACGWAEKEQDRRKGATCTPIFLKCFDIKGFSLNLQKDPLKKFPEKGKKIKKTKMEVNKFCEVCTLPPPAVYSSLLLMPAEEPPPFPQGPASQTHQWRRPFPPPPPHETGDRLIREKEVSFITFTGIYVLNPWAPRPLQTKVTYHR